MIAILSFIDICFHGHILIAVEDASSYTTRMKGMIGFLAALYCTTMSGQNQCTNLLR